MKLHLLVCAMAFLALLVFGGCQDSNSPLRTVNVTVTPTSVNLFPDTQQQFNATVTGTSNTAVTWDTDGGNIDINGLYTAPSIPGTYLVTATSVVDTSASDTVEVVVLPSVPTGSFAIVPTAVTLNVNDSQQFTPIYTNLTPGVTWEVVEANGGTIDENGLYTAPNEPGTFHVRGTSTADPTKTATAVITVLPVVEVSVSPGTVSITAGTTQQFDATVTGTSNTAVTWAASAGVIDANGLYTAPETPGTYIITATSVEDPTKSATAEVTVTAPPPPQESSITISPSSVILEVNQTQQFTAILVNLAPGVTWTVEEGAAGGSITSDGLYTASNTVGTFHVTATSVADPTKSSTATVSVVPVITMFMTPKTVHLLPGQTKQFKGHAEGATDPDALIWSVVEVDGGTISDTGLYTAPDTPGTYHVVVTSVENPAKKYTATVFVDTPL